MAYYACGVPELADGCPWVPWASVWGWPCDKVLGLCRDLAFLPPPQTSSILHIVQHVSQEMLHNEGMSHCRKKGCRCCGTGHNLADCRESELHMLLLTHVKDCQPATELESHAFHAHASHIEQSSSLTGMYSNLPEMVPDTSPAWGAVAFFIGLAGLKGLSLSCPGAPGSAFSLHV